MIFVCVEKDIICPRLTALCVFGINFSIFYWYLTFINAYSMFVGLFGSISSIVILLLLWYTFPKQNYDLYKYAYFISIIYGFVFTILRIIGIIIVSKLTEEMIKISAYILFPLAIILDWLLVGIILCYKKKVQDSLEPKPNELNILPDNKTAQEINMNKVA